MQLPHGQQFAAVCCPSCFESFEVACPPPGECPTEWDYDCEVCCRPMVIQFSILDGHVVADARGIND
ncbi:MAG TPA: CPXCG motif-containing cysteine-rich protein [Opitutaceae bacterium]